MSPLNINVVGTGNTVHKAERGILTLQAQSKNVSTAEEASAIVTATANSIRDLITPHCPQDEDTGSTKSDAAISHYSMSTLDTNVHRDRRTTLAGEESKYDITYSAGAKFNIKFSDFSVLDTLATQLSAMTNVRIEKVDWRLTDQTYDSITSIARKNAAHDAIRRARDYAEVFAGLSAEEAVAKVKAVNIDESNYYTTGSRPRLHYGKVQRQMMHKHDKMELQFQPEDISLEVKVTGKFVVEE